MLNVAARAFDNYPGAPRGGSQTAKDFPPAWLSSATTLEGNNAHVFSDELDDDSPAPAEEIPRIGGTYNHVYQAQAATRAAEGQDCPSTGCSYNNFAPTGAGDEFSWRENREQAGTQLFYYVNRFHDHLRDAPGIGFNAASGGFEGGDRLNAQVEDGASTGTDPGFTDYPDCSYLNNADFTIAQDGISPRMQMFLWSSACDAAGGRHQRRRRRQRRLHRLPRVRARPLQPARDRRGRPGRAVGAPVRRDG